MTRYMTAARGALTLVVSFAFGAASVAPAVAADDLVVVFPPDHVSAIGGHADYLELTPEEFVEGSVDVHHFLLGIAGKLADPFGGCGLNLGPQIPTFGVGTDTANLVVDSGAASVATVGAYYCLDPEQTVRASVTLLVFLAAVDASSKGSSIVPSGFSDELVGFARFLPAQGSAIANSQYLFSTGHFDRLIRRPLSSPFDGGVEISNAGGFLMRIDDDHLSTMRWNDETSTFDTLVVDTESLSVRVIAPDVTVRAALGGELWVGEGETLRAYDPATGALLREFATGRVFAMGAASNHLVIDITNGPTQIIDPSTGSVLKTLSGGVTRVIDHGDTFWVHAAHSLHNIDATTLESTQVSIPTPVVDGPHGLSGTIIDAGDTLWLGWDKDVHAGISIVDSESKSVLDTVDAPASLGSDCSQTTPRPAAGPGDTVWVTWYCWPPEVDGFLPPRIVIAVYDADTRALLHEFVDGPDFISVGLVFGNLVLLPHEDGVWVIDTDRTDTF